MKAETMTEQERAQRNLNPTKEARAAMWLYGREYAQSGAGSMDFWDKLDDRRKRLCRDMVSQILEAPERSEVAEYGG